jgi:polyisoprenoid-binding protein YceI
MFALLLNVCTADSFAQSSETAPPAAVDPVTYALDPARSWLYAVVYNDTSAMASRLGHDHAFRPKSFDGSVVWDLDDPAACKVDLSFPVTSLWPDPAGLREREGLSADGAVGEDSKPTIVGNLQGKGQLDASRFPTIEFHGTSCSASTGAVTVAGTLSIRGVPKAVTAVMNVTADKSAFAASGTFRIKHSDFGFAPFSNLAGALRNKDEIKVVVDVKGSAR